jgi:hypothetical protein
VTFCVETAPTPARTWAQRAATLGEDEDTAMPNMPVSAQRPETEKVMRSSFTLRRE